jgi:hypothetical protein
MSNDKNKPPKPLLVKFGREVPVPSNILKPKQVIKPKIENNK